MHCPLTHVEPASWISQVLLATRQVDKLVYLVDIRFDALVANGLGVQPFAIHR